MSKLILFVCVLSSAAYALPKKGVFTNLSAGYWEYKDTINQLPGNDPSVATEKDYNATIKLGYLFESSFMLGVSYNVNKFEDRNEGATSSLITTIDFKGYGPVVGVLIKEAFYIFAAYHFSAGYEYKTDGASNTTESVSDGTGTQYDLGYVFKVSDHFSFGPQITYWTAKYKKLTNATASGQTVDLDKSFTMAGLSLFFVF